jgi:radical SAM superfamily enzyme YgiQ (UPF0313 family)
VTVRVLLISANRAEINMRTIPLGLASVASVVREAGHSVRMIDLMETEDAASALTVAIEGFRPEVVGISLRNIDDQNMRSPRFFLDEDSKVIELVKKLSGAPVVLGGAGYSIFPEAALAHTRADMGIQGEGEGPFRTLVERLEKGQSLDGLPGLYMQQKGLQGGRVFVKDLDGLPLPETDLFSGWLLQGKDLWVPVQTRRGCPMGCSYCSTGTIEGTTVRRRSPARVVEWMARLGRAGARQFYFVDNTFNLPVRYARSLCGALTRASLGATWRCIIYPYKMEEPLAAAMAEAGCVEAAVGFETGCEGILRGMNKRFRSDDVRVTFTLLRRYGIRCMGFLLLGGPGETRQSVQESLDFADSLEADSVKITVGIRIYPYTPLAEEARRERVVAPGDTLLFPRFYVVPGLEEWIREIVARYGANRPGWIIDR